MLLVLKTRRIYIHFLFQGNVAEIRLSKCIYRYYNKRNGQIRGRIATSKVNTSFDSSHDIRGRCKHVRVADVHFRNACVTLVTRIICQQTIQQESIALRLVQCRVKSEQEEESLDLRTEIPSSEFNMSRHNTLLG